MREVKATRRQFVAGMGALGALSAMGVAPCLSVAEETEFPAPQTGKPVEAKVDPVTGDVTVNEDVVVRNINCVGCYIACGNRIKLDRETGRILGVGGNPYHPYSAFPPLPFEAPLVESYQAMSYANGKGNATRGTVCGRGNGVLDSVSQPNRITVPLKRAGARGEGKWQPISWEQLVAEVTEGGKLFADLGEDQEIEGFKSVHDTQTPIDPERPDLGPKSNQIIVWNTRADGRRQLNARFANTFGTLNNFSHNNS